MDLDTVTELVRPAGRDDARLSGPGDAWLAGGTWLFSEPQRDLRRLVDLSALGWPDLRVRDDGLEIAATCTMAALEAFAAPADWTAAPLLRQCCHALLGSYKVQNEATVGGNICLALPAGPMTSLTCALDGVATVWRPDGTDRQLPVTHLVVGPGRTSLEPGELLRSVTLPGAALRARTAFRQHSLSRVGRSAVLVVGRLDRDGTAVVTITASTPRPLLLRFDRLPDPAEALDALRAAEPVWHADVHGDPRWREHLTRRCVEQVCAELAAT